MYFHRISTHFSIFISVPNIYITEFTKSKQCNALFDIVLFFPTQTQKKTFFSNYKLILIFFFFTENDPGTHDFVFYEPELTEEEKMQLPLEKEFVTDQPIPQEQEINQDQQVYDAESQEFQFVQDQAQHDHVHGHEEFNQDTNKEELGVLYETSLHYLESLKYFVSFLKKIPHEKCYILKLNFSEKRYNAIFY